MSNELQYGVGVDATDLNTGVTAVEARLDAAGVKFEEGPRKFAKESAAAFEETFAAEDKLAKFRSQAAFNRMDSEEQLSTLRQQALGLFEKIGTMEGQSAEKSTLQLELEKKKADIFQLSGKLVAEQTAEIVKQTPAHEKNTGLIGALHDGTEKVKKGFKDMGISLEGAGLGILLAGIVNLGKEAVANAQKQRDEYDRLGKPLDTATRSMAGLGDALASVKKLGVDSVGFLLGGFTQLGDLLGSSINRLRGISEATENIAAASGRAADAAEARVKKLKEEQHDTEKIASAQKSLDEARRAAAYEQADLLGKLNILTTERAKLAEQIKNTEQGTVAYFERQEELLKTEQKIRSVTAELGKKAAGEIEVLTKEREKRDAEAFAKEIKRLDELQKQKRLLGDQTKLKQDAVVETTKQLKTEADITAELERQRKELERQRKEREAIVHLSYTASDGTDTQTLSDRQLAELLTKTQQQLSAARQSTPNYAGSDNGAGFIQNRVRQIQDEIYDRNRFRQSYQMQGEGAFKNYAADDENRYRRYITPEDEQRQKDQAKNIADLTTIFRNVFGG